MFWRCCFIAAADSEEFSAACSGLRSAAGNGLLWGVGVSVGVAVEGVVVVVGGEGVVGARRGVSFCDAAWSLKVRH